MDLIFPNGSRILISEEDRLHTAPLYSTDWTNLYVHSRRRHAIVYPGWQTYRRIKRKSPLRRAHGGRMVRRRGW